MKSPPWSFCAYLDHVAPYEGAWIEIPPTGKVVTVLVVAPYEGATKLYYGSESSMIGIFAKSYRRPEATKKWMYTSAYLITAALAFGGGLHSWLYC